MAKLGRLTVLAGAAEAARRYVRNNPEKVNAMADKAARFVDTKTKGKYSRQIGTAVQKVRSTTTDPRKRYGH